MEASRVHDIPWSLFVHFFCQPHLVSAIYNARWRLENAHDLARLAMLRPSNVIALVRHTKAIVRGITTAITITTIAVRIMTVANTRTRIARTGLREAYQIRQICLSHPDRLSCRSVQRPSP